jgi:hypothetical protein
MLKKLVPESLKESIKDKIKSNLSLVPQRSFNIASRVASRGVDNFLKFDYEDFKTSTLKYVEKMNVSDFSYTFSASNKTSVLYGSIYACMIKGLFGELDTLSTQQKREWADFFDSFQSDSDGYFRDPNIGGDEFENKGVWGDGWGIRHLAAHIIIAYARLGFKPKYEFKFLDKYYDEVFVKEWLDSFDFSKDVWSQSNYIMNAVTLLQFARDHMDEVRAGKPIKIILDWLRSTQRSDSGMWHNYELNSYHELGDAIRGAYHFYPLFFYENEVLPHGDKIIEVILSSQNSWGAFEDELMPSGACEDIDAIDPLIRFSILTNYKTTEVKNAIQKSLIWYLSNLNSDLGFEYMLETPNEYGGHKLTSSKINEANLFATWFRTLGLAYILDYLNIDNDFNIGRYPGYEIKLPY